MSLVKLIAQADERALAASGLACLDRCLPVFAQDADVLRPLWAGILDGPESWSARLTTARQALDAAVEAEPVVNVETELVRTVLGAAPGQWAAEPLRGWADTCSVVALEIHQKFDMGGGGGGAGPAERLARCREDAADVADAADGADGSEGVGPLVAGELRRQIRILEILAEMTDAGGLRQAMDLSTEGQRVLRAVVSRRARARS